MKTVKDANVCVVFYGHVFDYFSLKECIGYLNIKHKIKTLDSRNMEGDEYIYGYHQELDNRSSLPIPLSRYYLDWELKNNSHYLKLRSH